MNQPVLRTDPAFLNNQAMPVAVDAVPLESPPSGLNVSSPAPSDPFAFPSGTIPESTQGGVSVGEIPLEDSFPFKNALYAGVAILAVATIYGFYQMFVNDFNPYEAVLNLVLGNSPEEVDSSGKDLPQAPKETKPKVSSSPKKPVAGNPYWILPNANFSLDHQQPATGESWTIADEAGIREGLGHRYVYQHYKAVETIRKKRWKGSEVQLKRAMGAKKFWTRMFAAVGLAEMGYGVSLTDLNKILEGERSELISGFFERFVDKPNGGQVYLLRQVIRLVDARSRLVILEGIAKIDDPLSDLYLYAATGDINSKVQAKAEKILRGRKLNEGARQQFDQVISGSLAGREYLKLLGIERPERVVTDSGDSPKEAPTKMITDADIDQELNNMIEEPGEVEVYDFDEEESSAKSAKKEGEK